MSEKVQRKGGICEVSLDILRYMKLCPLPKKEYLKIQGELL